MPFCPNCRYEYIDGVEKCPDCDADLVAELPPEAKDTYSNEEMEPVFATKDRAESEIVKGVLESAGILSWNKRDYIKVLDGLTVVPLAQETTMVLASQADEARKVIEEAMESGQDLQQEN